MPMSSGDSCTPQARGYPAGDRDPEAPPGRGGAPPHGIIGRISAECAFCTTALPLAEASMRSHNGPVIIQHKNRDTHHAWAA